VAEKLLRFFSAVLAPLESVATLERKKQKRCGIRRTCAEQTTREKKLQVTKVKQRKINEIDIIIT